MSDKKGATVTVLDRAARRDELALPVEPNERRLPKDILVAWILDKTDPKQKSRQCVLFTLSHDHKQRGLTFVTPGPIIEKRASLEERRLLAEQIAEEFDEESQTTAALHPDIQRFQVGAHLKDDHKEEPEYTRGFLVSPPPDIASEFHQEGARAGGDVDPAALLGHAQRLLDTFARQLTQNMQSGADRLVEEKNKLLEENRLMSKQLFEQRVAMEDLLDRKVTREIDALERKMMLDLKWKALQGALTYGGAFAKAFIAKYELGKGGAGGAAEKVELLDPSAGEAGAMPVDGAAAAVMRFAKGLKPKNLAALVKSFTPEQHDEFGPFFMQLWSEMSEEDQLQLQAIMKTDQEIQDQIAEENAKTPGKGKGGP